MVSVSTEISANEWGQQGMGLMGIGDKILELSGIQCVFEIGLEEWRMEVAFQICCPNVLQVLLQMAE